MATISKHIGGGGSGICEWALARSRTRLVLVLDRVFQVWRQLLDASRDIAWPRIGLWDPWDLYEISSCRLQSHPFEDEDDDEYEDES